MSKATSIKKENLKITLGPLVLDKKLTSGFKEWGTFKDSLRAPIHRWFTYPAGFSYKAVIASFEAHSIENGHVVYDPFMGSATTNLVAKSLGINSYGVEAHPFVFKIAKTKMQWDLQEHELANSLEKINARVKIRRKEQKETIKDLRNIFPELILKCYDSKVLADLFQIRESIVAIKTSATVKDILFVALVALLREVSSAATGWPYIAPKKAKTSSFGKDALVEFSKIALSMGSDIDEVKKSASIHSGKSWHKIFNEDSRNTQKLIPKHSVDHVFTSPPYLNNFDYADRTRLEMYFFGEAKTWGDLSRKVRAKLITSATTQISRNDPQYALSSELKKIAPTIYNRIELSVGELEIVRKTKGGKKSYDHLVSGYFNDMFKIIKEIFRVLKPGKTAVLVLGDSAPYGVHVPTEEILGQIGCAVGFKHYTTQQLRTRGEKWKGNTQRHHISLKESILTLYK